MTIVLDGNDGTGKSSVAKLLQERGYSKVKDRGLPTKATINKWPKEIPTDEIYFILDVPEEVSRERIAKRGLDLDEVRYHFHDYLIIMFIKLFLTRHTGTISIGTLGKHWCFTEQSFVKLQQRSMPTL